MASNYVQNGPSSVPGRGGPRAAGPQSPAPCPHLLHSQHNDTVPVPPTRQSRSSFRAFATSMPSTRKLFASDICMASSFWSVYLLVCDLQRKVIPAYPEEATCQPLHNTSPSLQVRVCMRVCLLGHRLFILQLPVCLHTVLQTVNSQPSPLDGASDLPLLPRLCAGHAILPCIPSSSSMTPVNPMLPFKFKKPIYYPLELSLIGHLPSRQWGNWSWKS